jgi:hypothetical protein
MELARGDYLLFMDDDDIFTAGALAVVRAALRQAPGLPHLFRMRYAADGRVLWQERSLRLGHIGTPMIAIPNRPQLRQWDPYDGHDYRFVADNLCLWPPDALVWREEVIALVRPHEDRGASPTTPADGAPVPRRVADCRFREDARRDGAPETARCRLVVRLAGVEGPDWGEVRRDACEACCASPLPSPTDMNPVIASLLYTLADQVLERGGVPGCPTARAEDLQAWAELHLARTEPDDGPPPHPQSAPGPCAHVGAALGFRLRPAASGYRREPVFNCRHPAHRETTTETCSLCTDWEEEPGPAPAPLAQRVPLPTPRRGSAVSRWAVGVTTAPRRQPTLERCLDSLVRAGWDRPRLFVDSAVTIAERFADFPVTLRESKLGAWPNYYLALAELLMREPDAHAFLLVQDDVILAHADGLRRYLELALWPDEPTGAVSLFCSSAYPQPRPGWHRLGDAWVLGAQAFIFPRESAKCFVADPAVLGHRWNSCNLGLANIDTLIGTWASRHGLPIYYPTPSLAQHIGDTSTLWPAARLDGYRRADRFAGGDTESPPDAC